MTEPAIVEDLRESIDARIEAEDRDVKFQAFEEKLEALKKQLEKYQNLPVGQLHILDSEYINRITEAFNGIMEGYQETVKSTLEQLSKAEASDAKTFRNATDHLVTATNQLTPELAEIKVMLTTLMGIFSEMRDAEKAFFRRVETELNH